MSWAWWDWPLTSLTNHHPSVLWHCWLGYLTRKIVSEMTYNVSSGTLNTTIPYPCCRVQSLDSQTASPPGVLHCVTLSVTSVLAIQEAQQSQRGRATMSVVDTLKCSSGVTQGHRKWHCDTAFYQYLWEMCNMLQVEFSFVYYNIFIQFPRIFEE